MTHNNAHAPEKTFEVVYPNQPWLNRSFKVRGICKYDPLNPCWDNRPTDKVGIHWGDDGDGACKACGPCTEAAKAAALQKAGV